MAEPSAASASSLKSHFNCETLEDKYIPGPILDRFDTRNYLDGRSGQLQVSEVPWNGSGSEKFIFDNPTCCMVFNAGVSLIEYGHNEILREVAEQVRYS